MTGRERDPVDAIREADRREADRREFIGHKHGIPPRCERCPETAWASWWHPRLNEYLCNEHSDMEQRNGR